MKVFAIDTSTPQLVVYYRDENRIITQTLMAKDKHTKNLSILMEILKGFEIDFDELDVVGIGIGPGSLTGLRIGISFALGLSIDKKIVTVPSTKIIAANLLYCGKDIVVVRKARSGYIYGAIYDDKLSVKVSPFVEEIEKFKERLNGDFSVIGDAAEFFGKKFPEFFDYPQPERLGMLVEKEIENGNFVDKVDPLYIQKSIAEINFEKRHRKDG
ncbi:peptidase M22 [Thermosipho sp. 1063]|uniref:tRNA (adenosine(37)-N6)-threonylcarbamoyltransferase complex dimerization subunit type 1 TsaB n=1 Tax=unclassified Thermosipho (in: thermotogales) TaxID=2676525 RepID=UPI000949352A|nr:MULTISPECIES: tRNA (adenosine(37)-N6)-threonylcarbamoyltransferase complex dimerization subunit type 1 TsaB [unclassified Thermosipho (in: thermotogales)]ANQ53924.1 peptidase M22 [Thermosipho sp. 1070]APT72370.1 peptidase M22 [Thermosipho sp. 1063]